MSISVSIPENFLAKSLDFIDISAYFSPITQSLDTWYSDQGVFLLSGY
jgi:hypothetical protein